MKKISQIRIYSLLLALLLLLTGCFAPKKSTDNPLGEIPSEGGGSDLLSRDPSAEQSGQSSLPAVSPDASVSHPSSRPPVPSTSVPPTPSKDQGPQEKRLSFLAAGDNLIHEAVFLDALRLGGGERYAFESMYNGVSSLISGADLSFVNHECPIAGDEYGILGWPSFNSPVSAGSALKKVGFDIVNVANNHILDMDNKCAGYKNTVKNLQDTGMLVIGGYTAADYDNLRILEQNGIKVAFLSYMDVPTNNQTINSSTPEMILPVATESAIKRQTALARAAADFVVVSIHWGTENSLYVNDDQVRLAKLMNSCGVDVILGHHSHTIQKVEWIESQAGKTLCYYSLGNLLSTQHPIKNLIGIFASFDLVIDENGNRSVENAAAIPHMTWYSTKRDALQIYRFKDVTEALVKDHGSQLRTGENGGTFTLADLKTHVEKQIPADFLKY